MKLSIIACVGKNLELGFKNDLIFHIKDDMKYFKNITLNHVVVMGRKTFESLPGILKGRKNVVITRSKNDFPEEVETFSSIENFMKTYQDYPEEIFVIGGASIYKQFLDFCDKLYLTEVDKTVKEADVYFPNFDKEQYDREIVETKKDKNLEYKFVIYRRK